MYTLVALGFAFILRRRVVTFAIGGALLGTMIWFVNETKRCRQMRAVGQNRVDAAGRPPEHDVPILLQKGGVL
jgi:hypothetical protein